MDGRPRDADQPAGAYASPWPASPPSSASGACSATAGLVPAVILPSPTAVLAAFPVLHFEEALVRSALWSFYRVTMGFALAGAGGDPPRPAHGHLPAHQGLLRPHPRPPALPAHLRPGAAHHRVVRHRREAEDRLPVPGHGRLPAAAGGGGRRGGGRGLPAHRHHPGRHQGDSSCAMC